MSNSIIHIDESWKEQLADEFSAPYFKELKTFLQNEKKQYKVYPPGKEIFAAFNNTPFKKVKVVIIGQDPYHGPGQANGLSFSVNRGLRKPPSLANIFKELQTDLGIPVPQDGDLSEWAKQGVLLLNATLTVRESQAGSHQNKGWEQFTDAVIKKISDKKKGVVFLLWGRFAHSKEELINDKKHFILKAAHPSPLARGAFFGCKHFSKTNRILETERILPIDWRLEK
ncbi:MAG: uracil-DNA glycosylase [Bacteroidota bacterium]|nr:uracil-DNA glycosylase [Bacteroidota bacterium]